VSGNWVQPTAHCNLKGRQVALAAFWVGLDGYKNKTVEQTGTEADCEGKVPVYYAWYELYPERLFLFPIKAVPGSEFHAEVTQSKLFLENVTTGEPAQFEYDSGSLEFASAEWIAEKPFNRFTDFGEVEFSGASASGDSGTHMVQGWEPNLDSIELVSGQGHKSNLLAEPTGLSGGSFSIKQTP
jgi:Peptidase A4 family